MRQNSGADLRIAKTLSAVSQVLPSSRCEAAAFPTGESHSGSKAEPGVTAALWTAQGCAGKLGHFLIREWAREVVDIALDIPKYTK